MANASVRLPGLVTWPRDNLGTGTNRANAKGKRPVSDSNVTSTSTTDVVLIGAGIMSATLGALLRLVEPDWSITMIERLDGAAAESSDPWNNAGTGHSALCELNYTPENPDGSIDISKAIAVNEQFQVSRQFWAHAIENGVLADARSFINPVPHVSFVHGADRVEYLRKRRDTLATNPLFATTEFIDDADEFARRLPFMAAQRDFAEPVALNWTTDGTDIDFGSLSKQLIGYGVSNGTAALFGQEVRDLSPESDGSWTVKIRNRRTGATRKINARFVFVGAGGDALHLLQKSGIKEAKGLRRLPGGRPVPAHRQPGGHRRPPGQGVRLPAAGRARPCRRRTWTPGSSTASRGCCSGRSPGGRRSSSSRATSPICRASVKPHNLASMVGVGLTQMSLVNYSDRPAAAVAE